LIPNVYNLCFRNAVNVWILLYVIVGVIDKKNGIVYMV